MDGKDLLYDEIYSPEVVMARVGHLDRRRRQDIELVTRLLRDGFNGAGVLTPKPKITQILLLGPHARRTWVEDDETLPIPSYAFWIIVSDRRFTRKRLWPATEARIADALGGRCTASLSFSSARCVRAARKTGDPIVIQRLVHSITLFRANRDAPQSRRRKGAKLWFEALAKFEKADAALIAACETFRDAERRYFAQRRQRDGTVSAVEDAALRIETGLDAAIVEEQQIGAVRHDAALSLLHTPAPDLAAILRKLERVRDEGDGDDHATISILADLRWLAARSLARGRPL